MVARPPGGAALRWLGDAAATFVNLEAPLCNGGRPADKLINLRASPALARPLRQAGVTVATLANNHALDFGAEGLVETLRSLQDVGIQTVGAGASLDEAFAPAVVRVGDTRVACLGMASTLPPGFAAGPTWAGIAPVRVTYSVLLDAPALDEQPGMSPYVATACVESDVRRAEEAVKAARAAADVVIVAIHWGVPHGWLVAYQGPLAAYQQPLGRRLVDAGADVVVGHHPHTVHGVERYRSGVICYSLGNFLFHSLGPADLVITRPSAPKYDLTSLTSGEALEGAVLMVTVDGGKIRAVSLRPMVLDEQGEPQLAGDRAGAILGRIVAHGRALGTELTPSVHELRVV
jgi:poly-gamma-glutamate synthesis protein (capsule biosynthesis protein)